MTARASRLIAITAVLAAGTLDLACYDRTEDFQPAAYGAKPWDPPDGWDPEPPCATGYYVAIDSCPGCSGISYALCTGTAFTQCVCGGPAWPGVECPKALVCCANDFPPVNWLELLKYSGPGWAGLSPDADTRTCP
ncbi:MAG: hypothetical protein ABUS79_08805 [Pseudomonadota bacterium]